jgi:hypothetical protein
VFPIEPFPDCFFRHKFDPVLLHSDFHKPSS